MLDTQQLSNATLVQLLGASRAKPVALGDLQATSGASKYLCGLWHVRDVGKGAAPAKLQLRFDSWGLGDANHHFP